MKNLKPSPAANPLVNRCIECGFCESNCPSRWAPFLGPPAPSGQGQAWASIWVPRWRRGAIGDLAWLPLPPRRDITLTPRQRIAVYKELFRLRSMENRTPAQQVGAAAA